MHAFSYKGKFHCNFSNKQCKCMNEGLIVYNRTCQNMYVIQCSVTSSVAISSVRFGKEVLVSKFNFVSAAAV